MIAEFLEVTSADMARASYSTTPLLRSLVHRPQGVILVYTSKTPYVAIDERGLVRSIHLFLFSCVH